MPRKNKYYMRPYDKLFETSRTINGKRVMFRGKTCREVDRKILEYTEKQTKGRTFPEVADEWWGRKEDGIRDGSRQSYKPHYIRAKEYFPGYIKDITPMDVKTFLMRFEAKGFASSTVRTQLNIVVQIFSYAVLNGDLPYSPALEIQASRNLPRTQRNALTVEQEQAVESYRGEDWLLGMMLLYTGCRRGELFALTWQDIDREAGVIHIDKKLSWRTNSTKPKLETELKSKNGKRDIPLLEPLAAVLPRNRIGIIFSGKGGYCSQYEVKLMWARYAAAVGLHNITPHCFRHSFATICYEAGVDPKTAASFLGDTEHVTQTIYQELRQHHQIRGADLVNAYLAAREQERQA